MNDLISRKMAIKAIVDLPNCYNGFSDTFDKACIIGVLEELVPVDAIQVVRCKDCKHYADECCDRYADETLGYVHSTQESGYCWVAERKEE